MDALQIDAIRRFNRAYTTRIGVLDESYLGTGRPLGPSRLLFEVAPTGSRVRHLRRTLDLDSGYVSRLLRQLEDDALITVGRDPEDGRQRIVRLTDDGRRERTKLDDRSQGVAARLIEPLPARQRHELTEALAIAERILRSAAVRFVAVDHRSDLARTALAHYFAELDERFHSGFDPGQANADHDADAMSPPDGTFVVVTSDESAIGCGGVQRLDDVTAEIKRMWIDREWRGLGLGARLLTRLEDESATLGRARVVLDTNGTLTEAIAMYERSGYHPIDRYNTNPYAHHWFAKDLAPDAPMGGRSADPAAE